MRELRYRQIYNQAPVFHECDTIAQQQSLAQIVGYEDRRFLQALLQSAKFFLNLGTSDWIECAEWFIEEKVRGIGSQSPRHSDSLALASGELLRIAVEQIGSEANHGQQFSHSCANFFGGPVLNSWNQSDIFFDSEMRKQSALLNDVSNAAAQANGIPGSGRSAVHADFARARVVQAVDQSKRSGFARPAAAE